MFRLGRLSAVRVIGGIIVTCALAVPAAAQGADREEHWQFSVPLTYFSGANLDGGQGSTADLSSDVGWGIAFGYNFDNRWYAGFEATWLSAHYNANIVTDNDGDGSPDGTTRVSGDFDGSNIQFVGQFNILDSRITPFVRGNVGWTYVDSNIASGPPVGGCWWVWPWGYICDSYVPTYDTSKFSYGGSVGVRGDVSERFFLEASYYINWVDLRETESFDGGKLNIGWTF